MPSTRKKKYNTFFFNQPLKNYGNFYSVSIVIENSFLIQKTGENITSKVSYKWCN